FASRELEGAFKEEYERESLRHIRFAVAMGLFLVAIFGVLDAIVQPAVRNELWLIRYGVLCPTAALVLVITFVPGAFRYVEWALLVMVVVVGAGILAMILIAPPPGRYFYYAGLILVIMYSFVFLKLRFAGASAKRRRRHSCDRRTRSSCTILGSPKRAPSTASWSCWRDTIWRRWCSVSGPCPARGLSSCWCRCAIPWPRRTSEG